MRRFPIRAHTLFMDNLDYAVQIQVPESVRTDLAPLLDVLRALQPPEVEILSGSRDHLFFSRRFTANGEWYWAVNDTPQARRVTVRFPSEGVFEKWDAETGERFALPAKGPVVTLKFGPWDAYFVMRHAGPATAPLAGAGARAWQPFEIDFTPHARRGAKRLRIRVANSNAGWMAQGDLIHERGAWGVNFASERDRLRTLRPNGLEGPVCILAVRP